MTDKEKIKAFLESLKKETSIGLSEWENGVEHGRMEIIEALSSFIDSMQEEPVSGNIDFEQELYKAFGQVKDFTLGMQIAKRFYDMGKNNGKEPISEELEEEIKRFYDKVAYDGFEYPSFRQIATYFAQWKKEQMMKDAVLETKVYLESDGDGIESEHIEWLALENNEILNIPNNIGLKDGDKVKVIIIKED